MSNEVSDITVNESNKSSGGLNEVNAINPNVAIIENVADMESVDVMAGADAATSGRPLTEVIDEGLVDLSSDGVESFFRTLLPLHYSPLCSPILPPTLLMLWMRATVPPGYVFSSFSFPSFWSSWISL